MLLNSSYEKRTLHFTIEGKCYAYSGHPSKREEDFFHLYVKLRGGNVRLQDALIEFRNNIPQTNLSTDEIADLFQRHMERFTRRYRPVNMALSPQLSGGMRLPSERSFETDFVLRSEHMATLTASDLRSRRSVKSAIDISGSSHSSDDDNDVEMDTFSPPGPRKKNMSRRRRRKGNATSTTNGKGGTTSVIDTPNTSSSVVPPVLSSDALQRHNMLRKKMDTAPPTPQHPTPSAGVVSDAVPPTVQTLLKEVLRKQDDLVRYVGVTNTASNGPSSPIPNAARMINTVQSLMGLVDHDSEGMTQLHRAAINNDLTTVQELIRIGAYVDTPRTGDGATPLMLACESGCLYATHALLQHGANIGSRDRRGATPLHFAASRNRVDVITYLLSRGASATEVDKSGRCALHYALLPETQGPHIEGITCLLKHGIDVNATDNLAERTPLHYACAWGWVTAVKYLLSQGADPWLEDCYANNSFYVAAQRRHADVVHQLSEVEERLQGWTTLHLAAIRGQDMINQLITIHPEQVNNQDAMLRTELHLAVAADHTAICDLLLAKGGKADVTDIHGNTALHDAASRGQISMVRTLLHYNRAILDAENNDGSTPYYLALYYAQYDVCQYLREMGCDVTLTPEQQYRLERRRRQPYSKSGVCGQALRSDLTLRTYLEIVDDDTLDEYGRTPLHCSCFVGDVAAVKMLVRERPHDIVTVDHDGNTPMHWACMADVAPGSLSTNKAAAISEILHLLYDHNSSLVYKRNHQGRRPIDVANADDLQNVVSLMSSLGVSKFDVWYRCRQFVTIVLLIAMFIPYWIITCFAGYVLQRSLSTCVLRSTKVLSLKPNDKPYAKLGMRFMVALAISLSFGVIALLGILPVELSRTDYSPSELQSWALATSPKLPNYMVNSTFIIYFDPTKCSNYSSPIGLDYKGNVSWTMSGILCKPWPGTITTACRNPNSRQQPWCFTRSPYVTWDYCSVEPRCLPPPSTPPPTLPVNETSAPPSTEQLPEETVSPPAVQEESTDLPRSTPGTAAPVEVINTPPPTPTPSPMVTPTQSVDTHVPSIPFTASPPTPSLRIDPPGPTPMTHNPTPVVRPTNPPAPPSLKDKSPLEIDGRGSYRTRYVVALTGLGIALLFWYLITLRKATKDPACTGRGLQTSTLIQSQPATSENFILILNTILFSLGLSSVAVCSTPRDGFTLYNVLRVFTLHVGTFSDAYIAMLCITGVWLALAFYIAFSSTFLVTPALRHWFSSLQPTFLHPIPLPLLCTLPHSLCIPILTTIFRSLQCSFLSEDIAIVAYDSSNGLCMVGSSRTYAIVAIIFLYLYTMTATTIGALRHAPRSRHVTLPIPPLKIMIDNMISCALTAACVTVAALDNSDATSSIPVYIVMSAHALFFASDIFFYVRSQSLGPLLHACMLLSSLANCVAVLVYDGNRDSPSATTLGICFFFVAMLCAKICAKWHKVVVLSFRPPLPSMSSVNLSGHEGGVESINVGANNSNNLYSPRRLTPRAINRHRRQLSNNSNSVPHDSL